MSEAKINLGETKVIVLLPQGLILEDLVKLGPHVGRISRMPWIQGVNVREITPKLDESGRVTSYTVVDKYVGETILKVSAYATSIFDESGGIRIREDRGK